MILENIDIDIDINMVILENIDIDIDIDINKAILQNIDIDKISNRFKFGISNRANSLWPPRQPLIPLRCPRDPLGTPRRPP